MATIRIGNTSTGIIQPEQPIHMNPDGSGQASITYKCSEDSSDAVIPAYLTSHPYLPALKAFESDLDREPGGIIRITTIYKGVLADSGTLDDLAQLDFSRTMTEAPLETHPIFALPRDTPPVTPSDLAAIELALQNCTDGDPGWSDIVKLLFAKKRRGIESYLKPGAIFKKSYISASIPDGTLLATVGSTVTPDSPCPAPPTDQDYLRMGVSWKKQAGVVYIDIEDQLSGPGGWDPDLYPPPP